MGQFAYRLTSEEAARLRQDFSRIGYAFEQALQFVMVVGAVSVLIRILTFPLRLLFSRRTSAHVKEIVIDGAPGASWFWWTYVTFVTEKGEKRVKLYPSQAVRFIVGDRLHEADSGRLTTFGRRLVSWTPVTEAADVAPQVFVSYSQKRRGEAELVANVMKGRGLKVWRDQEQLEVAESLPTAICAAIESSAVYMPLLSPEFVASEWCRKELDHACDSGVPVMPVKITGGELYMPGFVRDTLERAGEPLFVDLDTRDGLEQLRELSDRILVGADD